MKEFLFLGDSITDCNHSFDPQNLGEGYVRILAKELGHFDGTAKIRNMGVDGFTISALTRLWNLRCKILAPDFITILVGINDISIMKGNRENIDTALNTFRLKYEMLIEQIQQDVSCPIILMEPFIFPHPAEFQTWEYDVRKMNNIVSQIAQRHRLQFVPLLKRLLEAASEDGYDAITIDGVHLTSKGHRILADAWLEIFTK